MDSVESQDSSVLRLVAESDWWHLEDSTTDVVGGPDGQVECGSGPVGARRVPSAMPEIAMILVQSCEPSHE